MMCILLGGHFELPMVNSPFEIVVRMVTIPAFHWDQLQQQMSRFLARKRWFCGRFCWVAPSKAYLPNTMTDR